MVNLYDALMGNNPNTTVAGVKRGRGRPRKIVQVEGRYIHDKADKKSEISFIGPDMKYKINFRYNQLVMLHPEAKQAGLILKLSEEFGYSYSQIHKIVY
jgi:hypothetical protein